MKRLPCLLAMTMLAGLTACTGEPASQPASVVVQPGPLRLHIQATGSLQATQSTPLMVPGRQWSSRQLTWLRADGSEVKKGEVVARFSATQSEQDLAQAEIDLKRNLLARAGTEAQLGQQRGELNVDLANVAYQLAIADRYANADLDALARNKVLDAVQDREYLGTRQDVLEWQQGQTSERGQAELAVLDAKRNTLQVEAQQKRDDLDALELRAPHDGIFMLQADWGGEKPRVGTTLFAGRPLASLPDTGKMEIEIAVPQVQAQGIKVGDVVKMHPLGQPDQTATSKISWIAAAGQTRSRRSPVKYLMMKALVPKEAIVAHGWMPQQRFAVDIVVLQADQAIGVPNLAIDTAGEKPRVYLLRDGEIRPQTVVLGARGASRSEVTEGLRGGERVVLQRPAATTAPAPNGAST